MRIQSELCHIDDNRAIVCVSAWQGEKPLGNTLGEGHSINVAEDNGIQRLLKRLRLGENLEDYYLEQQNRSNSEDFFPTTTSNPIKNENLIKKVTSNELVRSTDQDHAVVGTIEPEEWSKELVELDILVRKLKWTRIEENKYLLENFGYVDRNRITSYKDLVKYLSALKKIANVEGTELDSLNTDKYKLISDSDNLLKQLAWDTTKAREFLKLKMNLTSRQQLDHDQLVKFNNLLEVELNENKEKSQPK